MSLVPTRRWLHRGIRVAMPSVVLVCACGSAQPPPAHPAGHDPGVIGSGSASDIPLRPGEIAVVPGRVERPEDVPAPLLTWLRRLVTATPAEQDRMIDWERVTLVREAAAASLGGGAGGERGGGLGVRVPDGCEPAFARQDGYSMIAFPPAMIDMTDETAALVDRGVSALQEGEEILVLCNYARIDETETDDGQVVTERIVEPGPAFVLNVVPRGSEWRVQAWAWLGGREDTVTP